MESAVSGAIIFLFIAAGLVCFYLLPTAVGFLREHPNAWPIFFVNLFLGWTLVGWVVALTWSTLKINKGATAQ